MISEDLSQFFDDFAVVATITRGASPVVAVVTANVIFDLPSQSVTLYETEVEEPAPFLMAPASVLANVKRGDDVSVNGAAYKVERIRPDGTGLTRLDLKKS
jgi:hypothetical protein